MGAGRNRRRQPGFLELRVRQHRLRRYGRERTRVADSDIATCVPSEPVLKMGPTTIGEVVVDTGGMTVYVYDNDEVGSGASSCRGPCLESWPPVTSVTENPVVQGLQEVVVDTIPAADGTHQLTVNGRPVYRYKDDNEPGDAFGQAVGSVWWTLDSSGNPVTTTAGGE